MRRERARDGGLQLGDALGRRRREARRGECDPERVAMVDRREREDPARVDECLQQLLDAGYDAWIVVEQDRVLAPGEPFDDALESAERNRAWLRERGL